MNTSVAVIGSGPAGLMAADVLLRAGYSVELFEKRKAAGRKLLIAGSSGLNITFDAPIDEFARHYWGGSPEGESEARMRKVLSVFGSEDWRAWIEALGIPTFLGTSHRYFVEGMKASKLLKVWIDDLKARGLQLHTGVECTAFSKEVDQSIDLLLSTNLRSSFGAVCFALGGGSYEEEEKPLRWPKMFVNNKIGFAPFEPSNCGFEVNWPMAFIHEAEGKPIKNLILTSSKGTRSGDCVITRYGLEGTPVYFAGVSGTVLLDLKPSWSHEQVLAKLQSVRENFSVLRRVQKTMNLGEGAMALLFHLSSPEAKKDLAAMAQLIKCFPLNLLQKRSLDEAISSAGGVLWEELDDAFMLKKFPGIFLAGEMIDWDAPTGGFLIQASVSQGHYAATQMVRYLKGRVHE